MTTPLMRIYLLSIFSLLTFFSFSQSVQLEATIHASDLPPGTGKAVVYSSADSTLVKGSYIDSSLFRTEFDRNGKSDFYLKITAPGFSDTTINFTVTDSMVNLGEITLVTDLSLDEVKVTYVKPMFERTMDGVKVNVDGTSLAQLTTLFDVLKASPRLSSPDDESIEIIGMGSPLIMIDRQAIISNDELKAIPANQVDRIEIITNPSAKYKAQGSSGGVIEVYTKNFSLEGYNMSVGLNGGLSTQKKPVASGNLGLSYKKKKFTLNCYGGFNYQSYNNFGQLTGFTTDGSNRSLEDNYENYRSHLWAYYNVKGSYKLADHHQLRMGVNGTQSLFSTINYDSSQYFQNNALSTEQDSYTDYAASWKNTRTFMNYTWETDTLGSVFEVNVNYVNKTSNEDVIELSGINDVLAGTSIRYDAKGITRDRPDIGEVRVNYLHQFDTTGWSLNVGGAYSLLINGKRFNQSLLQNDEWIDNPVYSNSYDYQEDIVGAFAEVSKKWDKIGFRVGLRSEYTKLYGHSQTLDKTFMDSSYVLPFPNASILYQPNDKIAITLMYKGGIDRPQFSNYDPFVRVLDSLNIEYGNPYLKPSYIHTGGISVDVMNTYNFSLNYSKTDSPVSTMEFIRDGSFITESTPWNAKSQEEYSFSTGLPVSLPWLQGWNSMWVSVNKYDFTEEFKRETFYNTTFGFYSYMTFILPKKFSIMNMLNVTKWGSDQNVQNARLDWGIRLTKKFVNNDLQFYVEAANIIPTKMVFNNVSGNYETRMTGQNTFTTFKLGMYYRFGRLKAPQDVKESSSGQENRL